MVLVAQVRFSIGLVDKFSLSLGAAKKHASVCTRGTF